MDDATLKLVAQRENPCVHQSVGQGTAVTSGPDTLYWSCAACGHLWHNLPQDHPLRAAAVAAMNATQGVGQ